MPVLAKQVGYTKPPSPAKAQDDDPFPLSEIYDDDLEELARAVYQRDYMMFGFGNWGD